MNHKLISSLTASLLIATLGVPIATDAKSSESTRQDTAPTHKEGQFASNADDQSKSSSSAEDVARFDKQSNGIVKVGEQQSQTGFRTSSEVVAKVQPHIVSGREAAILYVRNIPILTFLGARQDTPNGVKVGTQARSSGNEGFSKAKSLTATKVSSSSITTVLRSSQTLSSPLSDMFKLEALNDSSASSDPVWRASVIAARINQLDRDGVAADKITVSWENSPRDLAQRDRLVIRANRVEIATLDSNTILPDTTRNPEVDALQATNRLRRLLGNAAPLREVGGQPTGSSSQALVFGPIRARFTGFASWYGPGFHGNPSASGERFNQHALTAAHRTLPFGTRVLVTNLDNGQSVVVRINDRGPFHGNRVIDVSTAAARVLGLISSGVARVRLDVVDPRTASADN
jgi:rare lipoprotein A